MPLNLNDLMKKAEAKGFVKTTIEKEPSPAQLLRPWQQESVLFNTSTDDNKPTTNRQQTDNKQATNRQQTGNKLITNRHRKKLNRQQSGSTTDNTTDNKPTTNRQQTDNKPTTKIPFSLLVGLQRAIVIFIYNECKIARSKSTKNLTLEYISKSLNTSPRCIKTTIQRLEAKGIIDRLEYKNGRGGWSKYAVPDLLFQELLQHETDNKVTTNWQQSDNKVTAQPTTQPTTSISSSSSFLNLNNKTTTTTCEDEKINQFSLSKEWKNIDFENLSKIGFTETHLTQIASQNMLTPEMVQNSIYAYAFDLEHNDKGKSIKGSPLNYFIGTLRRGQPYTYPQNYESPQERSKRLYADRLREIEQKRVAIEKETFELAFKDWVYKLSDQEIQKLLPSNIKYTKGSKIAESAAKEYFSKEVWVNKQLEITK